MTKQQFLDIIDKYVAGTASQDEIDLLKLFYNSFQENKIWNEAELGSEYEAKSKMLENILAKIEATQTPVVANLQNLKHQTKELKQSGAKIFPYKKIVAAASILALITTATYLFLNKTTNKAQAPAIAKATNNATKNDILPGSNKATLTLADGTVIDLDDAKNGAVAQQGNTKVIKIGGKLAYNNSAVNEAEVVYNTLTTPKGGQYQVELPDGSMVWLNAASSLRFPTAFAGKERRVEVINGEAYFEVTKNKEMPFIVSLIKSEIQVLGTHFNVMAYTEEAAVNATLLEGAINFVTPQSKSLLKPGEQIQLFEDGRKKILSDVDVEQVVAWKNGLFQFDNSDVETVMRQLSRWYDVSVVYKNEGIKNVFVGEMPRSSTLAEILKALSLTSKMNFKIEGRKIIVL